MVKAVKSSSDKIAQEILDRSAMLTLPLGHWWISEAILTISHTGVLRQVPLDFVNLGKSDGFVGRIDVLTQVLAYISSAVLGQDDFEPIILWSDPPCLTFVRPLDSVSRMFVFHYLRKFPFPPGLNGPLFRYQVDIVNRKKLINLKNLYKRQRQGWNYDFDPPKNPRSFPDFIEQTVLANRENERFVPDYHLDPEAFQKTISSVQKTILGK